MEVLRLLGRVVSWVFRRVLLRGYRRALISVLILVVALAIFAKTITLWLPGVVGLALLFGILALLLPRVTRR